MNDITLLHGDCLDHMRGLESESIDLTVTSPPYDDLRTYNGFSFDFENIAKELYRITKNGGVVVWVVGDATKDFCESLTSFRQAIYFVEECGFNLLDTMIYQKRCYAPAYPGMMRYAQNFEYMFVLAKGKPKTFNPQKIMKSGKQASRTKTVSFRQKNGELKPKRIDYDQSKPKDMTNVWKLNAGYMKSSKDPIAFEHPAIFPEELARLHILTWSNVGDVIFDPFLGSGTTAKMAIENHRKFIGCELSAEYIEIAKKRLQTVQMSLF